MPFLKSVDTWLYQSDPRSNVELLSEFTQSHTFGTMVPEKVPSKEHLDFTQLVRAIDSA
jgi:hypothetical protein